MNRSEEEYSTSRRGAIVTAGALATAGLAGCGSNTSDNENSNDEDSEPTLKDVNIKLSANDSVDFTEDEEYALGLEAELEYDNGDIENPDLDYEVQNLEIRKTGEEGKSRYEKDRELVEKQKGYGFFNGIGENLEFTEFTDEDLKKAGHHQELEDIEIQDGQIILNSDDLITGYSQIDLNINIIDEEISQYVDTNQQNIVQVDKPEEQMLEDLQVTGPEAVELWQKYREIRAEIMLDKLKFADIKDVAIEKTRNELQDEENPDIQTELGYLGTKFGREVQRRFGVSPSGTATKLAHALASTDFQTSNRNGMAGVISDNGHNSNPIFVPGSNDPRDEEYWEEGKTLNVNTQLEDAAHPPDQLVNYASGPYGQIFKKPEKDTDLAEGTFDSFMELSQEIEAKHHDMIDEDYAVSLVDGLGDDTNEWHDNLQHIMETAVGNLFSTEHDLIPTGSAEEPEVEVR